MSQPKNAMEPQAHAPLTEDEIHALVDGQVSREARAALQVRLRHEPQAQATLLKWQHQREALKGMYQEVLQTPAPASLVTAVQASHETQQDPNPWWRWGGMAAGLMLAFGVGWMANTAWRGELNLSSSNVAMAKKQATQDFVRQASFAHRVYAPEVRHPVEVSATEQEHLIQWLSKRVGKPLKVPNLGTLGYELVGGRLLPGEAGARAQFMFQNPAGTRITLYLGAVLKPTEGADTRETSFKFVPDGPVPSFYWIDQGFGYAVAGAVPRDELMKLSEAVYRQL